MPRRVLLLLPLCATFLQAQSTSVLAHVNGVPVTSGGSGFLVREMKREGLPVILSSLGQNLITVEALRQAAVAKGLQNRPETKARMAFQEEDALAAVCQERLQKDLPAFSTQERDAVWAWVLAHALTQYEVHRVEFESMEEAQQYRGPAPNSKGMDLDYLRPFWALPHDPALSLAENRILEAMIASGKPRFSGPYRRNGQIRILVFMARKRMVDPLLLQELEPGQEPDAPRLQGLLPAYHLRHTLDRLRRAAGMAPLPAPEAALNPTEQSTLEAEARQLWAQEARRRGLDREFAEGIAVARTWALAQDLLQADLQERPITEVELKEACLREGLAPVAFQFQSRSYPTREEAKAALKQLTAKSASPTATEDPWISQATLPARAADALRRLPLGAWAEEPVRGEGTTFLALRLLGLRPEPGFEATLERRRDALLAQLRLKRWYDLGAEARRHAKIQAN